ncbi:CHAT domain-containing protein [Mycena leptocephala]|nr:CHAT domain-containing protein [Mycena leptocephala]
MAQVIFRADGCGWSRVSTSHIVKTLKDDNKLSALIDNGTDMMKMFEISARVSYLNAAVAFLGDAVSLCGPLHFQRAESLNSYANALYRQFELKGDMDDLEESMKCHQEALELRPGSHPDRSDSLNNLANVLLRRFERTGQLIDLEQSIVFHQEALQLSPGSHPGRSDSLNNLASALSKRFEQTGQLADLEESIASHLEALELRPGSHPNRSESLNNLASALLMRFKQTGQLTDLEESIAFYQEALELRPGSHPNRSTALNNLAYALATRFEQTGQLADSEESIAFHREALELFPGSHPSRSTSLNNLANALLRQFEQTGQLTDLEESIAFHREALELNLASTLLMRFERTGQLGDLEESIGFLREALELRPNSLNNLAITLSRRFQQTGQLIDLEESIAFHQEALELFPGSHPNRPDSLNNLASALSTRFEQTGQLADLEESIGFLREALELLPGSHPNQSGSINNLASALLRRFEQTGQLADLEQSIAFHREALDLRPGSHPYRSDSLHNLASALSRRFEKTSQIIDLEESIALQREALDLFPGSHPHRSDSLNSLANALSTRFEQTSQLADLKESIAFHEEASTHETSSWARKAASFRHPSAMQAYQYTINLLPRLASLDLNIRQRQEALCAIREDKFDKAVEFLCAGRAVFWAQALQLRTPLDELHSVAPQLAQKLQTISNALEATSAHDGFQTMHDNSRHIRNLEKEVTHRRILNKDWNDTVEAVRKLEGFDGFLLPKSISKLQKAACNGPVVLLNAADSGCDALVVTQKEPSSNRYVPTLVLKHGLGLLWFDVACPIIDALNLKKQDILPRIWWCPTGPFAFLPIHAAGVYEGDNPESFSDYAISSYTPTLDALLASPPTKVDEPKMLAVIQHEMPGNRRLDLPFALKELDTIERYVPWLTKLGTKEEPTSVGRVLSLLPDASFVHFACHGTQDLVNPLESALLLGDGDLKVSKIMQNSIQNASLAFLSACETAMGDENVPDEAMHLAATMLFAGFRGVVGTMWTMDDEDGPKVVDVFYNHIFGTGRESHPDSAKAAEALHLAIKNLRTEKKVSFRRWVPFIHLGL